MIKHYVEYYYPGSFFSETSVKEIAQRDVSKIVIPDDAFGFKFFDRVHAEIDGVELQSKRLNISQMHFYGGRIMSIEDVRRECPDDRILLANMEYSGWKNIIVCRTGNTQPFRDGDVFIIEGTSKGTTIA